MVYFRDLVKKASYLAIAGALVLGAKGYSEHLTPTPDERLNPPFDIRSFLDRSSSTITENRDSDLQTLRSSRRGLESRTRDSTILRSSRDFGLDNFGRRDFDFDSGVLDTQLAALENPLVYRLSGEITTSDPNLVPVVAYLFARDSEGRPYRLDFVESNRGLINYSFESSVRGLYGISVEFADLLSRSNTTFETDNVVSINSGLPGQETIINLNLEPDETLRQEGPARLVGGGQVVYIAKMAGFPEGAMRNLRVIIDDELSRPRQATFSHGGTLVLPVAADFGILESQNITLSIDGSAFEPCGVDLPVNAQRGDYFLFQVESATTEDGELGCEFTKMTHLSGLVPNEPDSVNEVYEGLDDLDGGGEEIDLSLRLDNFDVENIFGRGSRVSSGLRGSATSTLLPRQRSGLASRLGRGTTTIGSTRIGSQISTQIGGRRRAVGREDGVAGIVSGQRALNSSPRLSRSGRTLRR